MWGRPKWRVQLWQKHFKVAFVPQNTYSTHSRKVVHFRDSQLLRRALHVELHTGGWSMAVRRVHVPSSSAPHWPRMTSPCTNMPSKMPFAKGVVGHVRLASHCPCRQPDTVNKTSVFVSANYSLMKETIDCQSI